MNIHESLSLILTNKQFHTNIIMPAFLSNSCQSHTLYTSIYLSFPFPLYSTALLYSIFLYAIDILFSFPIFVQRPGFIYVWHVITHLLSFPFTVYHFPNLPALLKLYELYYTYINKHHGGEELIYFHRNSNIVMSLWRYSTLEKIFGEFVY